MNAYQQHQEFNAIYDEVASHSPTSHTLLKLKLCDIHSSASRNLTVDLDFVHRLLKHYRHCDDHASCAVQRLYDELETFVIETLRRLKACNDLSQYSLLTCVNDLLKNLDTTARKGFPYDLIVQFSLPLWSNGKIYVCRRSIEICHRLLASGDERINECQARLIVEGLLQYVELCKGKLSKEEFFSLVLYEAEEEYTEFFYSQLDATDTTLAMDRVTVKRLLQITLAFLQYTNLQDCTAPTQELSERVIDIVEGLYRKCSPREFVKVVYNIYNINDDDIVNLLGILLELQDSQQSQHGTILKKFHLTPNIFFLYFLQVCGNTHQIIIDMLVDSESDEFLRFFLKYTTKATGDIDDFLWAAQFLDFDLDDMARILRDTMRVLNAEGFPYNAKPLVRILQRFYDMMRQRRMQVV